MNGESRNADDSHDQIECDENIEETAVEDKDKPVIGMYTYDFITFHTVEYSTTLNS